MQNEACSGPLEKDGRQNGDRNIVQSGRHSHVGIAIESVKDRSVSVEQ